MIFEVGNLYHICNQGNNGQKTFFSNDNYLYFLTKIKDHILPHADILAWCLMPNHFHLMVYVHTVEILVSAISVSIINQSDSMTQSHTITGEAKNESMTIESDSMTQSHTITTPKKTRNFNNSIGLLLRSYTRAINLQQNKSGSLFKQHSKAECITKMEGITPSFFNTSHGTVLNQQLIEKEYPQICFDYIHSNPVKAGLVSKPEDWIYSSCCDFKGLRNGKLINKQRVEEFGIKF